MKLGQNPTPNRTQAVWPRVQQWCDWLVCFILSNTYSIEIITYIVLCLFSQHVYMVWNWKKCKLAKHTKEKPLLISSLRNIYPHYSSIYFPGATHICIIYIYHIYIICYRKYMHIMCIYIYISYTYAYHMLSYTHFSYTHTYIIHIYISYTFLIGNFLHYDLAVLKFSHLT